MTNCTQSASVYQATIAIGRADTRDDRYVAAIAFDHWESSALDTLSSNGAQIMRLKDVLIKMASPFESDRHEATWSGMYLVDGSVVRFSTEKHASPQGLADHLKLFKWRESGGQNDNLLTVLAIDARENRAAKYVSQSVDVRGPGRDRIRASLEYLLSNRPTWRTNVPALVEVTRVMADVMATAPRPA